jgi:hypothetical protein
MSKVVLEQHVLQRINYTGGCGNLAGLTFVFCGGKRAPPVCTYENEPTETIKLG